MKHLLLVATFFLVMIKVQSQNVGIGTSTPATILDVVSTTKGILIPRLNTIQMKAIVGPANGLIITNTDSANRIFIYTGATGWKGLSFTSEGTATDISTVVHKTGMDSISGTKIFASDILVNGVTIGRGSGGDSTNTAIGRRALFLNSFGQYNTALGDSSLYANIGGTANTSIGNTALFSNTSGGSNTAEGYQALYSNTTGDFNTGGGAYALYYNTSGTDNVAYGFAAANYTSAGLVTPLLTANNSLFLGANTRAQGDNQTNQIVIGNSAIGDGDNSTVIGNSSILSTKIQGKLKLPAYGTGANTGIALFNLATDGSGNIIEVASGNSGGGDMFLAGSQNVTGVKTFDTTQKFGIYRGHDIMDWRDKSHPTDSMRWYFTNPIGGGIDLNLNTSGGRFILDGDFRVLGAVEFPNGLVSTIQGQNWDIFNVGMMKSTTIVSDIDIIRGGDAQSTFLNGNTAGYPLILNAGTSHNSSSNVLIGTTTDDAVNKLQINGAIKSTQFSLSALNTAPTSKSDTGILGEVRITSDYIYVCIATNTWVRSPLATW